ncbi:hypothetical protein [Mangrovicoccus algicola]|uniref:PEP-CTERM sorting domain-containing protein n=1 Tax=Mangrovicoccus algicola TaxID=2771008 RepID=A0A8J6YVL9_9RHOB|nr:hypothetical protein [Mangrovicoccus algicola]MBE3638665.1 hypothetical protein [Mangrovicoccus algicola]
MSRIATILVLVPLLSAAAPATRAGTLTLTYQGAAFTGHPFFPGAEVYDPAPLSGAIVLDTAITGGYTGGTISIDTTFMTTPAEIYAMGILSWSYSVPVLPTVETHARFTFSAAGALTDWYVSALDGPPDYLSTPAGDEIIVGDAYYTADPGSWTVSYVPLPGALWLALGGLAALGALRAGRAAVPG